MPFGLGKQEAKPREPYEKKVFDDFDGVIVDARWYPNNEYNNGPRLGLAIMNCQPSDKVMRPYIKMGKTIVDYSISDDNMLFSTETDLNENSGLARFTADMEMQGVNFKDERFNVDGQVSAAGFMGIKGHFKWVPESFEDKNKVKTEYERLTMTKFDGYVDVNKFLDSMSGTKPAAASKDISKLEGVTPELFETAKELLQVFCMDARSHTEIIAYAKKTTEIATNAPLMAAIKERSFLEGIGLTKDGTKYKYSG